MTTLGCLLGLMLLVATCAEDKKLSRREIKNKLLEKYDKTASPSEITGKPVKEKISLYFKSLQLDTELQEMTLHGYVRQFWIDERLKFSAASYDGNILLGPSDAYAIWRPDTFIRQAVQYELVSENNVQTRIYPDGNVWLARDMVITTSCPMNLVAFPFDTQQCHLSLESFSHTADDHQLEFLEDSPVAVEGSIHGFTMERFLESDCSTNYSTGSYPCLRITFVLKRDYGSYSKHVFFPSAIILLFIYSSTWMGSQILTPRALVLVVSAILLTANVVTSSYLLDHPVVSYMTAVDCWYPVIVIMYLVTIIEFAIVARLCNKYDGVPEDPDSKYPTCGAAIEWTYRVVFAIAIILFFAIFFAIYTLV